MEISNETQITEFVLMGLVVSRPICLIIFIILFLSFIVTLAGNMLIIFIVSCDYHLHFPMYFFLACLSLMEISIVLTVFPRFLFNLMVKKPTISRHECFIQAFFYFFITTSDFLLLSVMSFDRYVAICFPLRYTSIMRNRVCINLVTICLIISFFSLLYPTLTIPNLPFCSQMLDHFFCDNAAMLKAICADVRLLKLHSIIVSVVILIGCLSLIIISYGFIVATIIRIPKGRGCQKTFSTCVSHLIMVSLVFGSAIFIELKPSKLSSMEIKKLVNFISALLAPLLNPFIYTLRNQKVKECIANGIKQIRKTTFSGEQ